MSAVPARKGFRLDTDLCTGCGACAVACAVENELPWGTSWRWIETFNPRRVSGLPSYHLSLACNHCADAPCMAQCPALAYGSDPATGAVLLDPERCIGCRYCTWACPYDAPRYDAEAGVVSKCTFCHHRRLEGLAPACVQQCPTGALTWGDLDALDGSAEVPGFPVTEAGPSVRFAGRRSGGETGAASRAPRESLSLLPSMPDSASGAVRTFGASSASGPAPPKTALRTEGPLVAFTLLAATLAGLVATPAGRALVALPAFLVFAALAAGASTLHLGRKGRAWRAVLNVRRSWLSREIAMFTAFVVASAVVLSPIPTPAWVGWAVPVLGFALLFTVDRVYTVTRTRGLAIHSAGVLLTGVMVTGLEVGSAVVWGGVLTAKILSYTVRKARLQEEGRPVSAPWTALRLASAVATSGLLILHAAPVGVGWATWGPSAWVAVGLLAFGEIVDRCEFYLELEVSTPHREMTRVWAERVGGPVARDA